MVQPGVLAERNANPVAALNASVLTVLMEEGQLVALPPRVLQLGQLRSHPLHLLAQRRNLGVHPRLVELADAPQLPLDQLQAGRGKSPSVSGHRSSINF